MGNTIWSSFIPDAPADRFLPRQRKVPSHSERSTGSDFARAYTFRPAFTSFQGEELDARIGLRISTRVAFESPHIRNINILRKHYFLSADLARVDIIELLTVDYVDTYLITYKPLLENPMRSTGHTNEHDSIYRSD